MVNSSEPCWLDWLKKKKSANKINPKENNTAISVQHSEGLLLYHKQTYFMSLVKLYASNHNLFTQISEHF